MQYLLCIVSFCTFAAAQTISSDQHLKLHSYNKRPSLAKSADQRAHRMHRIDEKKAKSIARKVCRTGALKLQLTHHDIYLYYIVETPTCTVYVNAMDGSVIDPVRIQKEGGK